MPLKFNRNKAAKNLVSISSSLYNKSVKAVVDDSQDVALWILFFLGGTKVLLAGL